MILGFYARKSHNLIGLGIFHGDLDFFYLHEKSLGLSNYEIFPHKIIKSRTFKKSSILIVITDPDPSINRQKKIKKYLDFNCLVTSCICNKQCGGSGINIRIRLFSIPDPNCLHPVSSSKNLSILTPKAKKWFLSSKKYDPGCSSRIRIMTFSHPGSKGQKSTQSRIPDPDPQHW